MDKTQSPKLIELCDMVEQLFNSVKEQGAIARDNLIRSKASGDADQTEREIHSQLMKLGMALMEVYFKELGNGNLGSKIQHSGKEYERKIKDREVTLLTVFGVVRFLHCLYYEADGSCLKPVEAMANLPDRKASYFVQDLLARLGIDYTYEGSRDFFADLFDISTSKHTGEEIVNKMSECHEPYEAVKEPPAKETEGTFQVVSFDGKGVPVVPEARRSDGTKREALVGAIYTVNPNKRNAQQVTNSLVRPELLSEEDKQELKNRDRAKNIHYQSSIANSKEEVFADVQTAAKKRFLQLTGPLLCIMDGASVLWRLARQYFPDAIYILDIMHVLEYIWEAANVLEKNESKARHLAAAYLKSILQGQVDYVIRGLNQRITKNDIRGKKLETLNKVITYFKNHREYMRYDEYLAKGYPIGTGVIESACGHLVKDRMEKSGARWSIDGAEAILKLRCIKSNGDWKSYQEIRKNEERNRLYPRMLNAA